MRHAFIRFSYNILAVILLMSLVSNMFIAYEEVKFDSLALEKPKTNVFCLLLCMRTDS